MNSPSSWVRPTGVGWVCCSGWVMGTTLGAGLALRLSGEVEEVRRAEMVSVQTVPVPKAVSWQDPAHPVAATNPEAVNGEGGLPLWSGAGDSVDSGQAVGGGADDSAILGYAPTAAVANAGAAKLVQISFEAGVLFDDNVFLNARDQVSDVLYRISPSIRLGWGDTIIREESFLTIHYRPEAIFFQELSDENALDHDARVAVQKRFKRTTLGGHARFQRLSGSTVDLADRVDRSVVTGGVSGTYGWTGKTSFQTTLDWESTRYHEGGYADYDQWTHESFVVYAFAGKSKLAGGFAWGQLDVDGQSRAQDFQRGLVRFETAPTARLSLEGRGGVEFRQTAGGDDVTPVFGLGARYQWREGTSFNLQASRSVEASGALAGQNYVRTAISGGVRQRIGGRFIFSLDAGWENYEYTGVDAGAGDAGRDDDSYFVRPAFTYSFRDNLHAEAWYQWRKVASSEPDQSYRVNQAGVNFRIDF